MFSGMRAGYEELSGWSLNMFTSDELSELHTATLDVLEHAGLMVMSDEAQEIFYSHGCQVDKKTNIVRIPSYLVEHAIKSAPAKILLAGRDPKHDYVMGGRRTAYTTCGTVIKAVDFETGKVRESAVKDVTEAAILTDALDEITILFIPVIPRDVPDVLGDIVAAEINFNNCTKHFQAEVLSTEDTRRVFNMGVAVAGSAEELLKRPVCSIVICPVSPLQLGPDFCDVVIETARLGLPLNVLSQALAGATGPVTLAGTLIVQSAEVLGGITLAQLVRQGLPVIYGSSTSPFDLSSVNTPMGSPELGMISAGVAKLAQYYNLPSLVAGTQSDSKVLDGQAMHEKTMSALVTGLAGANLIYGMGQIESGLTYSSEQLVIDNDVVKMAKRVIQGIDVTDETMAVDIIKQVHDIKDFLHQKHTIKFMREKQSRPKLMDRTTRGTWEAAGSKDLNQRAREETSRILKNHKPTPLCEEVKKELRDIVAAAEKEVASS